MIKQKQLYRHRPEEGQIGDCARTVLACLMDLYPGEVPHFTKDAIEGGNEQEAVASMDKWVRATGHTFTEFPVQAGSPKEALRWAGSYIKDTFYTLMGTSANRVNHIVICLNDEIYWDTSIDDSGIVSEASDGYYWIGILSKGFTLEGAKNDR